MFPMGLETTTLVYMPSAPEGSFCDTVQVPFGADDMELI